jgi:hypothetical protein
MGLGLNDGFCIKAFFDRVFQELVGGVSFYGVKMGFNRVQ